MSSITRRSFFKFLTITAGVTMVANADEDNKSSIKAQKVQLKAKKSKAHRVVVVGGGMGGLTVAETIKANDPKDEIEVIVLERNAQYFACPMSNTLFGEIKEVKDAGIDFKYDYTLAEKNHNIDVIITEVIDADIKKKVITTTGGTIEYDYVVVAPGIDYNYKKLFPTWSQEKVQRAMKETPAAMYSDSGKEKKNLLNQLHEWKKSGGEQS
jgi:sulfide dehydrogenase [flavocytochrome c] flavoprotein subunit